MFPGNNLGDLEFTPKPEYLSAGLPTPDLGRAEVRPHRRARDRRDGPRRGQEALRAVAVDPRHRARRRRGRHPRDGGPRHRRDDRRTARTPIVADGGPAPARRPSSDVLKKTIIYFTLPNPDGWRRGSISTRAASSSSATTATASTPTATGPTSATRSAATPAAPSPRRARVSASTSDVRDEARPQFAAGDDLHGQPFADALSYTLMPHGRHDFGKDTRIRETAKLDQPRAVRGDQVVADHPGQRPAASAAARRCVPGALGDACAQIYAQTWGSVYDTINYTTTGALGDWFDSRDRASTPTASTTRCRSRTSTRTSSSTPQTEQLHVDGNKAIIYAHLAEISTRCRATFDAPGARATCQHAPQARRAAASSPAPPPGTKPQDDDRRRAGTRPARRPTVVPFEVKRTPTDLQRRPARRRHRAERPGRRHGRHDA